MIRIGISGVPSTGKTTLARHVALACRSIPGLSNVELVSEYARQYLSKHGSIETVWEQYGILDKQLAWEDTLTDKLDLMVTDSPIFLSFLYSTRLRNHSKVKDNIAYTDIFKKLLKLNEEYRYDIIFHLPPVIKLVDDGVRGQVSDEERIIDDRFIRSLFDIFPPKHFVVIDDTDMDKRIEHCVNEISKLIKKGA